jgi:hypothetical protein
MDAQTARRVDAEIAKLIVEAERSGEERRKLLAEASKYRRERAWYPALLMTTAVGATAALSKLIF